MSKFIIRALRQNGVEVVEIHKHVSITQLNTKSHLSVWSLIKRVLVKFAVVPIALRNLRTIRSCDGMLVGYPGHFDIPFAGIISKIEENGYRLYTRRYSPKAIGHALKKYMAEWSE